MNVSCRRRSCEAGKGFEPSGRRRGLVERERDGASRRTSVWRHFVGSNQGCRALDNAASGVGGLKSQGKKAKYR